MTTVIASLAARILRGLVCLGRMFHGLHHTLCISKGSRTTLENHRGCCAKRSVTRFFGISFSIAYNYIGLMVVMCESWDRSYLKHAFLKATECFWTACIGTDLKIWIRFLSSSFSFYWVLRLFISIEYCRDAGVNTWAHKENLFLSPSKTSRQDTNPSLDTYFDWVFVSFCRWG